MSVGAGMSPLRLLGMLLSSQGVCGAAPSLAVAIPTSPCVCFPRRVFKKTSPNGKVRTYRTYRAAPGVGGGTWSGFSFPLNPPDFSLPVLVPPLGSLLKGTVLKTPTRPLKCGAWSHTVGACGVSELCNATGGLAIRGSWMAVTNLFPFATCSPSSPSTWGRGTSWTTWSPWTLWVSGVPACSKSQRVPTNT